METAAIILKKLLGIWKAERARMNKEADLLPVEKKKNFLKLKMGSVLITNAMLEEEDDTLIL